MQRYNNLACLFAGADIDALAHIGEDPGVPDDRMNWCVIELEAAENAPAQSIVYEGGTETLFEKMIMEEAVALNEDFAFPNTLTVAVKECGEPNAFYIPDEVRVEMCTEYGGWLRYLPLSQ